MHMNLLAQGHTAGLGRRRAVNPGGPQVLVTLLAVSTLPGP